MPARRSPRAAPVDERRFHSWLVNELPAGHEGLLPLGDDAAAVRPPPGRVAILSIDSLVEGTHFLARSDPRKVGAAAAAVSLSDLAAKGATPAALMLAIAVPPGTPQRWLERVTQGAEEMAERFRMPLVGGDTKPGPVRTVVSSVLGWGTVGALAPRSAARPGDLVVTTGTVGRGGAAAAAILGRPRPSSRALAAMLEVTPRVWEGIALRRWAHAMLDTSDGLAEAARLLSEASQVRVEVDESLLPLPPALKRRELSAPVRRARAFYGGDYELLAALPARSFCAAEKAVRRVGGTLTMVGRAVAGRGAWLRVRGRLVPMPRGGWRPFARRPARRV